jgi:hypothetical protein
MAFEPQLVPSLREGVDIIKMVLYRELKSLLMARHADRDPVYVNQLTGVVVNELFGMPSLDADMQTFGRENRDALEKAFRIISTDLDHLKIPLTDALRIQFLCDSHEGIDRVAVLEKAETKGLLIVERDVPLPGAFMNIVRSFGRAYRILDPQSVATPGPAQTNQGEAKGPEKSGHPKM